MNRLFLTLIVAGIWLLVVYLLSGADQLREEQQLLNQHLRQALVEKNILLLRLHDCEERQQLK